MKVVAISDTHNHSLAARDVPQGDVLIHCGDATMGGTVQEILSFAQWFNVMPFEHKIFVPGNHDMLFENNKNLAVMLLKQCCPDVHYLEDQELEIEDKLFYGCPWVPTFGTWAFMLDPGYPLRSRYGKIPQYTDVLITHGPPYNILDKTARSQHVGSKDLLEKIEIDKPKINVFGHIHESYGEIELNGVHYFNASICNKQYKALNKPMVFEI